MRESNNRMRATWTLLQNVADAIRLRGAIKRSPNSDTEDRTLSLVVEGVEEMTSRGKLMFSDVSVDPTSGEITLRGQFDKPHITLLSGMYVRVQSPQSIDRPPILVPQRAVMRGADGQVAVRVLGDSDTVETHQVETGVMHGSRWQITKGLKVGDEAIVSALSAIRDGDAVVRKDLSDQSQTATNTLPH